MNPSKTTLWYEDLERHRQPSLYYLSSEDDEGGPHLICDWNGPPTDFDEFDIDIMSKMIQSKPITTTKPSEEDTFVAIPQDTEYDDDKIPETIAPKSNCSHTLLTENDGSRLDFLTVPPLVNSLLKRLFRNQVARPSLAREEPADKRPAHEATNMTFSVNKRGRPKKERVIN